MAFIPTDPRLEEFYDLGLKYFVEQVGADVIYPMHLWKHYEIVEQLEKKYPCVRNPISIQYPQVSVKIQ